MIISKTQIRSVTDELRALIAKKENAFKTAVKTFNSWKEIASFLKNLLSSMTRVKTTILNDEKELKEMKSKCHEFSKLVQIDTNDPHSESYAITFVEIQAIIGNTTPSPTASLIQNIQSNFKKLKELLEKERDEKDKMNQAKIDCYNGLLGRLASGKTMDSSKNPFKTGVGKEQKHVRILSDCKDYNKGVNERIVLCKDADKEVLRFGSEKNSPIRRRLQLIKEGQPDNFNVKDPSNPLTERKLPKNHIRPTANALRNREVKRNKTFSLTAFEFNSEFNSKPLLEAINILAEQTKNCSICNQENNSIILKCCGRVCIRCIRKKLIGSGTSILLNAFESEKKQDAMCACPIHESIIEVELLQKIFSPKELEKLAIGALKRERKERKVIRKDIKNPILCIDCKGVMNDDTKAVKICSSHKICSTCFT